MRVVDACPTRAYSLTAGLAPPCMRRTRRTANLPPHLHVHTPYTQEEYDIIVTPIDMASSYTHNVVFTHWSASMVPRARQQGGQGPDAAEGAKPLEQALQGAGAAGGAEDGQGRVVAVQQECIEVGRAAGGQGGCGPCWLCRRYTSSGSNRRGAKQRMHGVHVAAQVVQLTICALYEY